MSSPSHSTDEPQQIGNGDTSRRPLAANTGDTEPAQPDFATLYRPLLREAFVAIVRDNVAQGGDAIAQARDYAERGKPDFALGYLLVADLPDAEKRAIFAAAHERRAANTERRAGEFDRQFHRPFPLLNDDAARDRALARQIRAGHKVDLIAGSQLPIL